MICWTDKINDLLNPFTSKTFPMAVDSAVMKLNHDKNSTR